MSYTHLTREERYQIYAFRKVGHKQNKIAEALGRSPSTISRELQRNRKVDPFIKTDFARV